MKFRFPYLKPSLLKSADTVIGRLAIHLVTSPAVSNLTDSAIRSILIIRPGGIGDAVLLAPAINKLRKRYGDVQIHLLAERRNGGAFSLISSIDRLFLYDTPSDLIEVLRFGYDVVIDTEQWHRLSALIARLTRAKIVIGFDTNDRRRMFTHAVPYSHDAYEADSFIQLFSILGTDTVRIDGEPFLFLPENALHKALELLEDIDPANYITIFPGASIIERQWGAESFRTVVQSLDSCGIGIVIVGGVDDKILAESIVKGTKGVNLAGSTSIPETAAIISLSRLLISGDSGILHIAVGLGVPTVSLFGPGIAAKWAPNGHLHRVVNLNLECSPCTRFGTTPPCPNGTICISGISPSEVVTEIKGMLESGDNCP